MPRLCLALWLVFAGCHRGAAPLTEAERCRECLAAGKTWQGTTCTTDCALQDAACYRDACPGPCAPGECSSCRTEASCREAACRWNVDNEAMWCAAPRP